MKGLWLQNIPGKRSWISVLVQYIVAVLIISFVRVEICQTTTCIHCSVGEHDNLGFHLCFSSLVELVFWCKLQYKICSLLFDIKISVHYFVWNLTVVFELNWNCFLLTTPALEQHKQYWIFVFTHLTFPLTLSPDYFSNCLFSIEVRQVFQLMKSSNPLYFLKKKLTVSEQKHMREYQRGPVKIYWDILQITIINQMILSGAVNH